MTTFIACYVLAAGFAWAAVWALSLFADDPHGSGAIYFGRTSVRAEWVFEDAWLGVFWRREGRCLEVWVCLLPFLPLHFERWDKCVPHPTDNIACKHCGAIIRISGKSVPGVGWYMDMDQNFCSKHCRGEGGRMC